MYMSPYLQAIRAIAREFLVRILKPIFIIAIIVSVCVLALSIWLTTFSGLWWILVTILIIAIILVTVVSIVAWGILNLIAPRQSKAQAQQVRAFVDKLQRIADVTATPKIVLLFRLLKDGFAPSKQGFVVSMSQDVTSLKRDFTTLKDTF